MTPVDPVKEAPAEAPDPIPPVEVSVIGTPTPPGTTPPLTTGTVAQTPDHQPNLVVNVVAPVVAILVRFANVYLTMLSGLVVAGMTSNIIPAADFLHLVMRCAQLSVAGAGVGLLKDLVTVFGRLENKYPLLTGSI